MNIQGFNKVTLLDFPGRVACTVFTGGCDLRCPFCHNSQLVLQPNHSPIDEEEVFDLLRRRRGVLEGVALTGGEPLLQPDLESFLSRVRELGYSVKLDTNGTHPERLARIIGEGLVDYVAMDIKNSPEKYPATVGIPGFDVSPVRASAALLLEGKVDYEFRTTVVAELLPGVTKRRSPCLRACDSILFANPTWDAIMTRQRPATHGATIAYPHRWL